MTGDGAKKRWRAMGALFGLALHVAAVAATEADPIAAALGSRVDRERTVAASGAAPDRFESPVAEFYRRRAFAPAWIGHPDRQDALHETLATLRFDGLTPQHYGLALTAAPRTQMPQDASALADRDWSITRGFLRALLHLHRGRLDPRALDAIWNVERPGVDIEAGMSAAIDAVEAGRIDTLFGTARPQHRIYRDLREGLKRLTQIAEAGGWPSVPEGPTLDAEHPDMRIPVLRQRLALAGYDTGPIDPAAETFDAPLLSALRAFQEEQYLEADGRVGPRTRAALNLSVQARIDQVRANLERARWLLHDLPGDFVLVDIAGFRVRYIHDGRPTFTSRIQVGQPDRRTPIFRADITALTINPQWIVPPTILAEDIVPELKKNPAYLATHHLRAFDASGLELDAGGVDWRHAAGVTLRQDAGPDGALGRIAIRFPNRFAVYLHETPHTALFSATRRAFSSGCIRVEHPFDLAQILMRDDPAWSRLALDAAAASGATMTLPLPHPIPILLMYWTVDVHANGRLSYKPDVYGLDPPTLRALDADVGA